MAHPHTTVSLGPAATAVFTAAVAGHSAGPFAASRRLSGAGGGLNLGGAVGDDPDAVTANRQDLDDYLGLPAVWMRQIHSATVREVFSADDDPGQCDIIVHTGTATVAPAVLSADCVPLLLASHTGRVAVVAHVGRPGLMAGAAQAAIEAARRASADDDQLYGVIGPAICGRCYEVPHEMAAEVWQTHPAARATTRWDTNGVDIPKAVRQVLDDHEVTMVDYHAPCTYEDPRYYSYRWATHNGDPRTGRTASLVIPREIV